MRWALVDVDGFVTGVIVWDGETEYAAPDGLTLVNVPEDQPCGTGWTYTDGQWISPPPEPEEE